MILAKPPAAGDLLISGSAITAGVFARTVIYLLDCDEDGSLGVVVNQPARLDMNEVLPAWVHLTTPPQTIFQGGPVSPNGAICLARLQHVREEPPGWRRVKGAIGLLHLDTPVELVEGAYCDLRIFAGYAGWSPGQLEGEIIRGDWVCAQAREEDVFGSDPLSLWRRVLRRQNGPAALLSTMPEDPDLN
ncbi:YqgE/AlgH family protein [Acidipropionibacterium timonense]|uniref:YqgE/AlgH family protein n=1 Tax=Acidipropionibacterium timonense TaxID=2161818 RepID=UPI001031CAB6|nr:YqgE/AlgH family protein [Acidipropionibacterium timonense]